MSVLLYRLGGGGATTVRRSLFSSLQKKPKVVAVGGVLHNNSRSYHGSFSVGSNSYYFAHKTVMIPHDSKRHRAGEDAAVANDNLLVVADGVGGWAREGVNPANFSRTLVNTIADLTQEAVSPIQDKKLTDLVHEANMTTASQHLGSSTCTTVRLLPNGSTITCETLNIGDSGYAIFRQGADGDSNSWQLLHMSQVGQKDFNFPHQLGGLHFGDDVNQVGILEQHTLEPNDVIVVYTDGVSDNISPDNFSNFLKRQTNQDSESEIDLLESAESLARTAYALGKDRTFLSPFAKGARLAGWGNDYSGGKDDDITVIVAQVVGQQQQQQSGDKPKARKDEPSFLLYIGVPGYSL